MSKHTPGTLYPVGTRYSNSAYYDEATGEIVCGFQVFMQHAPDGTPTGRKSFIDNAGNLCGIEIVEQKRAEAIKRAAPEMLATLERLSFAAMCRDNTTGDPCRLIEVKAELAAANEQAIAVIAKSTGVKS